MTADTIGGVWTYALDLSRNLVAQGTQVVLATMGAPVQPGQRLQLARLGPGVVLCESHLKLEWMDDPWADVADAGEWLLNLERRYRPDIIHLNGYAHAVLPWRAPVLVAGHSCVFSWWQAVKGTPPPSEWQPYHAAVRAGLQCADLVVAPSRAMLALLAQHYGSPSRALVIPNGRDAVCPRGSKESVILNVGRLWDEAKNAAVLAAVAENLPWPVRLAGDARDPRGRRTVFENVQLLGVCSEEEIWREYQRATLYVHPARYEPFGLSVLEAALAGCALVLGDIASLRELWGGAAIFVPPDDPSALRSAIGDLIRNPRRREALAENSLQRARLFTTARMTRGYLSAYARLWLRPRTRVPAKVRTPTAVSA
ncbi:MAG: glycosyltransferase family 4 protein [Verrucomicrobia bacterium]|nr:glycosyltransferase family 4 protein [Verrucomicrobiota bacterium]